jgi:hypothetical protein
MNSELSNQFVPEQYTGSKSETVEYAICVDEQAAEQLFAEATGKLQNINEWNLLCGFLSTAFQLVDSSGKNVNRKPVIGDYIRVAIPGPGITTGGGFDWVRIERLTHIRIDAKQELFFMQVRPSTYPGTTGTDTAHFFKNSATSSFMIVRELRQVTAAIYGRNEVPNTETNSAIDNIRNQIVGTSGAIGMSTLQWKSLVSGLLKSDEKDDDK